MFLTRSVVLFAAFSRALSAAPASDQRAVIDKYCATCHSPQLHTGGLVLSKLDPANVSAAPETWERVVEKLRTGAMPPAGAPRPDKATYQALAGYLETELDKAAAANPQPGRVAVHRLNRAEYANAVRDLLGLRIDADALLPVDDSGYGFDNIADVLSVSPMLLKRYMSAAKKISRLAVGDSNPKAEVQTYELPHLLMQDQRMSEDLPLGSRGGAAIHHYFPVDGDYVVKVRLQRSGKYHDEEILGLAEPHEMEIRLDGKKLESFSIGGKFASAPRDDSYSFINGGKVSPEEQKYRRTADLGLEAKFHAGAGERLIGIDFVNELTLPEGALQSQTAGFRYLNKRSEQVLPGVGTVIVEGPYNVSGPGDTASREKIFTCRPSASVSQSACARRIVSTLARRAYRKPVTDQEISALMKLYDSGRQNGGFEAGVEMALQAILVAPEFLLRIENPPQNAAAGSAYRINDLELASRLSFFLWSSIPDDALLDAAGSGKLREPAVLEKQVRRMVADPRSKALIDNFAGQWLYLRNMRTAGPDPEAFPEFDENLRAAFQRETELFLEENLRSDRSVPSLLDADYTFLNERLARFYGIPNIYGSSFRRVSLGDDRRRGLLGQGSILTVTSYANRTSPTIRGKWLLENFLGTPPPPPPPNVPSLKEQNPGDAAMTMRQRMEQHRNNTSCAGCHSRMDPLGFALENFDGTGKWRTVEAGAPVDASGVLPDGTKFNGPTELRRILLGQPEQFSSTVTRKLLTYALGRGVEYYDAPAVRKIVRAAAPDYKWSSLILGIVNSVPFQMNSVKPAEPPNQIVKVVKP